jgi:hypothetical protein
MEYLFVSGNMFESVIRSEHGYIQFSIRWGLNIFMCHQSTSTIFISKH